MQVLKLNQIGTDLPGYPAALPGLCSNATIQAIAGAKIHSLLALSSMLSKQAGCSEPLLVMQHGKTQNVVINELCDGCIGVVPLIEKSPARALLYGFTQTWDLAVRTWDVLKSMVTGGFSLNCLAGPVGI